MNGNKTILASANITKPAGEIYIDGNLTLTNNGTISNGGNIRAGNTSVRWINASGSTLMAGNELFWHDGQRGILVASAPDNTIVYNEAALQYVKVPENEEYYNLSLEGSSDKTMVGDLKVLNNLTVASTLNTANYDLEVGGDWTNTNVFNEGTGTVTFNGSGSQSINNIAGETFFDLTIDKAADSLNLNGNVTVSGTLTMTSGVINTGSSTLTLGINTTTIGTLNRSGGLITGRFERWVNSTGTGYLFPIGTHSILPAHSGYLQRAECRFPYPGIHQQCTGQQWIATE